MRPSCQTLGVNGMHAVVRYPVIVVSSLVLGWLAAVALCFIANAIVGAGSGLVCGHNAGLWLFLFWIISFVVLAVAGALRELEPLRRLP